MLQIRKATAADLNAVAGIYDRIHTAEEQGRAHIGWVRGVYPERETAEAALERNDLYVGEDDGAIVGTAIINQLQVPSYRDGAWRIPAKDEEILVLHTLVIDPEVKGHGYGTGFVRFYEQQAKLQGCRALRMDTNARNSDARAFYSRLGYHEAGIVPCEFNGIAGVHLVLLEKAVD